MTNIANFIQNSENMLQGLVNDKITLIRDKLRQTQCSQAHKILSLAYFLELIHVLNQNNIFLNKEHTIGVKFLNYYHDPDSSFTISLNTDNNLLISTKTQIQLPCLDMQKLHLGLYIASGAQLDISQNSTRELYLNCPITMAPVHHWPDLILMNLTESPLTLEAGEVVATIHLNSPQACVMVATSLSALQDQILCAEGAALLSEQTKLVCTVVNAMAHLATLTAEVRHSKQTYFCSAQEKATLLSMLSQTVGINE